MSGENGKGDNNGTVDSQMPQTQHHLSALQVMVGDAPMTYVYSRFVDVDGVEKIFMSADPFEVPENSQGIEQQEVYDFLFDDGSILITVQRPQVMQAMGYIFTYGITAPISNVDIERALGEGTCEVGYNTILMISRGAWPEWDAAAQEEHASEEGAELFGEA